MLGTTHRHVTEPSDDGEIRVVRLAHHRLDHVARRSCRLRQHKHMPRLRRGRLPHVPGCGTVHKRLGRRKYTQDLFVRRTHERRAPEPGHRLHLVAVRLWPRQLVPCTPGTGRVHRSVQARRAVLADCQEAVTVPLPRSVSRRPRMTRDRGLWLPLVGGCAAPHVHRTLPIVRHDAQIAMRTPVRP